MVRSKEVIIAVYMRNEKFSPCQKKIPPKWQKPCVESRTNGLARDINHWPLNV